MIFLSKFLFFNCSAEIPSALWCEKIQEELQSRGLSLNVYDAYRPQRAVNHFIRWADNPGDTLMKRQYYPDWEKAQLFEEGYISKRSGHSRGSTLDLTLMDVRSGEALDMGSSYDYFGIISHHNADGISAEQLKNRNLLRKIMEKYGFRAYAKEWWHYTLRDEPFRDTYFDFPIK